MTSGTRAYKMHTYIKEVGSILVTIEPCFANYRTPESEAIFEREDDYVDILVESINEILNQKL